MRVLLTGQFEHRDFRHAVEWLDARCELTANVDLEQSRRLAESASPAPRLIVVAQPRPALFAPEQIERLHRAAPLARIVALLGSCCEGEARSGAPWPGVLRVYWHEWQPRMAELLASTDEVPAMWRLPRTATPAERLLAASAPVAGTRRGLVAIHAVSAAAYSALAEACTAVGYATAWLSPAHAAQVDGAAALIWDGASGDAGEASALRGLAMRFDPAPVIALLSFPRIEDHDRMLAAGADAVLSKPLLVDDLYAALERQS
jgi:hypothetical protein